MEEGISGTVFKNKNTKENFIYLQNSFGKKFRNCWKINCVLMIVLYWQKKAEERRQKLMESTRRECEKQAMTETARVARLHAKQVNNLNQRFVLFI